MAGYKISGGYISADYAEKRFCMNEANKLDMKAMVLNFYDPVSYTHLRAHET